MRTGHGHVTPALLSLPFDMGAPIFYSADRALVSRSQNSLTRSPDCPLFVVDIYNCFIGRGAPSRHDRIGSQILR
jgi:hypothetical protein